MGNPILRRLLNRQIAGRLRVSISMSTTSLPLAGEQTTARSVRMQAQGGRLTFLVHLQVELLLQRHHDLDLRSED